MKRREKILLAVVGSLGLLFAGFYCLRTVFIKPLRELDRQTLALRDKLRQINDERRAFFSAEDYLKGLTPRMFGRDPDTATAQAGKMLTEQIVRLNLQESQFSRLPVGPRKLRGAQEVGWSVQGEGDLNRVLDLIFTLEQTPQVHRLENLVLSAGDRPGSVRARFRYLTLVVDNAPEGAKVELKPKFALDSPQRHYYDIIPQRDLLRPYVPKPAEAPIATASGAPGGPEMLKIGSLSEWRGAPEVHVCDLASQQVTRYKSGDTLAGGQIVMIDYRTLPLPDKPGFLSYSRVIVKIGNDYWAIEQGQTLATKHQLTPDQMPPGQRGL